MSRQFRTEFYRRAGVSRSPISDGQSAAPSLIVSTINAPASNSSTQIYGYISGLQPDTTYTFYGFAQAANGLYYPAGSGVQIRTQSDTPPPSIPSHAPFVDYRLDRGFDLYWGSASGALWYELQYKLTSTSTWTSVGSNIYGTTYRLTGLQYGDSYNFRVRAFNNYGTSSYTSASTATVNPQTPTITPSTVTGTSIRVDIGYIGGNATRVRVTLYSSPNQVQIGYSQGSVTFSGLTAGVRYRIVAYTELDVSGTTLLSLSYGELFVTTGDPRPDNFVWSTPKSSGSAFRVTASEWVALQTRVNEFRNYRGLLRYFVSDVYNNEQTFQTPYTGNEFKKHHFNQVRNAIADMTSNVPPLVKQGDNIVAGSTTPSSRVGLNGLVNALNSIT